MFTMWSRCLLATASLIIILLLLTDHTLANSISCHDVKKTYSDKGLNLKDMAPAPLSGVSLQICHASGSSGKSCCSPDIEKQLLAWSSAQFHQALEERTSHMVSPFKAKAGKIEAFLDRLLSDSQRQFHDNFRRTYGVLYEKNAFVFREYFQELKNYYMSGQLDLWETTAKFFTTLYQKMFQVMNAQYTFDASYLSCVADHIEEVKPFGDVPRKMASAVKRSMVATRTLIKALKSGHQIVDNIKMIRPSGECLRAVQKMNVCPICHGYADPKPCTNFCLNVMKGCFAYQIEIQESWDKYADGLMSLADRLIGPFNVEQIVLPLDISISDAIMNFQDSGYKVTQKVFETCGTPKLLTKRDAPMDSGIGEKSGDGKSALEDENEDASQKMNLKGQKSEFEKLIVDLKQSVRSSQGFWKHLPYAFCLHSGNEHLDESIFFDSTENDSDFFLLGSENEKCWNGATIGPYTAAVVEDGIANQIHNPEVSLKLQSVSSGGINSRSASVGLPSSVQDQMFLLKGITNQLKLAHRGQDVEWWDRSVEQYPPESRQSVRSSSPYEGSGDLIDSDDEDLPGAEDGSGHDDLDEEGSGLDVTTTELEVDHFDVDKYPTPPPETSNGPWPWSPPASSPRPEVAPGKPSGKGDSVSKTSSASSAHEWQLSKTIIQLLLPSAMCFLATILTQTPRIFL